MHLTLALALAAAHRAHANPAHETVFELLGPAPIIGTGASSTTAGAVQAIAVDPNDKNTVWIGTVNGGVWKTTDFRPGEPTHAPTWTPLTDHEASLSIAALSIDPTDGTAKTVCAALGDSSSAGSFHGPYQGVLRTTDGGHAWTALGATDLGGQVLDGIAARGATIVVASSNKTNGGVWRSTDSGAHWQRISGTGGLPDAGVGALVGDPSHDDRLWVSIAGTGGGVFESTDTGHAWTKISGSALDGFATASNARRLALSVVGYAHDEHEVYVGVVDARVSGTASNIPAIFRMTQTGSGAITTDEMDASALPAFETLDQGRIAIAGDPLHDDQFFLTGDEGNEYRCTRAVGGSHTPSCTAISDKNGAAHNTHGGTAPHADARMLVFDTDSALIATDDGGVYLRSQPRKATGDWFPKHGNLSAVEAYWCAYDSHGKVTLCGAQDNGVAGQPAAGQTAWPQLASTDGGAVAVSDALFPCPWKHSLKCSSRYFSRHKLANFAHLDCDASDTCNADPGATGTMLVHGGATIACTTPSDPTTCGDPGLGERTPLAADRFDAQRIAIAGSKLYESHDGGATVSVVSGFTGTPTPAILMGGERSGHDDADLLYVGSSDGLFARTSAGAVSLTTWDVTRNGHPISLAVDRDDYAAVWLTTDAHRVWHGTDVTGPHEAWADVTGDLAPADATAPDLLAISHVGGDYAYIAVGADDGLYATRTDDLVHWWKLTGSLPNAPIATLQWSKADDLLLIATVGRSAWAIPGAINVFKPPILHVVHDPIHTVDPGNAGPGHVGPGDPVERTGPAEERRKKPR